MTGRVISPKARIAPKQIEVMARLISMLPEYEISIVRPVTNRIVAKTVRNGISYFLNSDDPDNAEGNNILTMSIELRDDSTPRTGFLKMEEDGLSTCPKVSLPGLTEIVSDIFMSVNFKG